MINFKSRCKTIQDADRITRMAKSVYPHISASMHSPRIYEQMANCRDMLCVSRLSRLRSRNANKIHNLRAKRRRGSNLFRDVIDMLKNHKIGNCYENAVLCEIIGKINGIKNIYHARILFNRNSSGEEIALDHAISIILGKALGNKDVVLKNKNAIILDPWLGITDFAENYFTKLKNDFSKYFLLLPDDNFIIRRLKTETKTPKEFHEAKKQLFKPNFSIRIVDDEALSDSDVKNLKEEFPELIIKNDTH